MDIRPLAEAVMETAGKIKNDNMSDQDFYKFPFMGSRRERKIGIWRLDKFSFHCKNLYFRALLRKVAEK